MFKKIFLIFVLVIFLISLSNGFCFAQRELEIEYPDLPGVETPTKTKTALPEYLKYVFTFAIIIAGLLAFMALIYGGFRYLTSAGDPTKMADARAQVSAGILGLIILLSSYLILNTINPQLVLPKKLPIEPTASGIRIYSLNDACQEDDEYPSLKVTQSLYQLATGTLDWGTDGEHKITSFEFLSKPGELTVKIYPENNFEGEPKSYGYVEGEGSCKSFKSTDAHRSIKLEVHLPGVHLYVNSEDCGENPIVGKKFKDIEVKTYQTGSATLPDFNDEVISIKFIYGNCDPDTGECEDRYAAILHEHENFLGKAVLFDQEQNNCRKLSERTHGVDLSEEVSSITIYLKPAINNEGEEQISGKGVRLWGDKNYTNEKDEFVLPPSGDDYYGKDYSGWSEGYYVSDVEDEKKKSNDKISSIEMDGHYVAVLFDDTNYKGKCEVFMGGDPDLRNNPIGQCGWLGRSDCLSSFIVKARK